MLLLGMANRRFFGSDTKKTDFPKDCGILEFMRILAICFINKNYVLNFTFSRIFRIAFFLYLAPTAVIF